ncbi:MAG: PilZ domain-containing protein [Gemmatimonadales bacterium]|jgi:hypothetical protein|nr:MAG: PilZ domain-containing protein [Gemmatimonadales bacterium]
MESQQPDRRGAHRYELRLVVTLAGIRAESRNLSSSGLYAVCDQPFDEGADLPVEIFFPRAANEVRRVTGTGSVTRVSPDQGQTGVGLRWKEWRFA